MSKQWPARFNVDEFSTVNRRQLLRGLGASALTMAVGGLFTRSLGGSPSFADYPFALGVASGDPAPDGFVIWTKIAQEKARPFGRALEDLQPGGRRAYLPWLFGTTTVQVFMLTLPDASRASNVMV